MDSSQVPHLIESYRVVRRQTEALCETLLPEDFDLQAMPEVSPAKWHLAHTTWFFEELLLKRCLSNYRGNPEYSMLFNSYYESVGKRLARGARGLLSRPTLAEIREYRKSIDRHVEQLFSDLPLEKLETALRLLRLGIHHEQQHEELILTDIKFCFFQNPLRPAMLDAGSEVAASAEAAPQADRWLPVSGGLYEIGANGEDFNYDNETPRHKVYLDSFSVASRKVTNGDYGEFIQDGGYKNPLLWLSDGWKAVQENSWIAPLYWEKENGVSSVFTLRGMRGLRMNEPVCHVSFYEADAFARWKGARLPTEAEWEIVARDHPIEGDLLESADLHPHKADSFWGSAWEWTGSAYLPYPGFAPLAGALGEYNAKFMSNQMVLRGGSCATPKSHIRASYRNYFPPESRWQFTGMRLAQ